MITVLHVDDEPDFSELVSAFLEQEDDRITVASASHPNEGLEMLETADIDCVVSDYDMPGTNGIEFLEGVRANHPDLPFILFTGKGSEEIASEAISAGVTDYLQKEASSSQFTVLANRILNTVDRYRAHQSVRETEEKLAELAKRTDDVLFLFDGDWEQLLFINDSYEEIWGASIDELDRNPEAYLKYVHPDDREEVRVANRDLLAGEPCHLEYRIIRPDGDQRWVSANAEPLFDANGDVDRIAGQVRDITARKERELQLETVISNLPGYVYRHDTGPDFSLEFVMGDSESITGYTPHALEHGIELANDVIHPDDREWVATALEESLEESGEFDLTYRIHRDDEKVRWIRDQGRLIEHPRSGEHYLDGFVTDVTEQRHQSDELMRTSELQRHSEQLTDVGGWEIDGVTGEQRWTDGTYLIHDLDPDGPFSPTVDAGLKFYHPEDRDDIAEAVDRCLTEGESYELELRIETAEDRLRWVHTIGVPVVQDGDIVGARGAIQDVSERKRRERELVRIRDFFTEAERLGNLGAWEFSGDGDVHWTDGTRRIHGVDDAYEPTIEEGIDFFHPEDRPRVEEAVTSALEVGGFYDIEGRIVTVDGDTRWVRIRGGPRDDGETIRGFIQDITEQKERENAYERARGQLEAAVSAGEVGTWEWDVETDTLLLDPSFSDRFGLDPNKVEEGVPIDEALSAIHPEDRQDVTTSIQKAIESCAGYEHEYRVIADDGDPRWVLARGNVECDDDGQPIRFPGVLIDITERKRQERNLERAHEEYRELFNGMNDSAWVIGLDERFHAVNDAATERLGYSREELLSMGPHDVDDGLEPGEISELIQTMPEDELQIFETVHETKDGRHIPVEISSTLISYQGETAILSVARDISDRKRREQQLEEFASVVSHDLRSPLSVAQGRLDLARDECDSDHLDRAEAAHQRMDALITDLLMLAREGERVKDTEFVDLATVVQHAWYHVESPTAHLEIDLDLTTRADRSRLSQVFENLFRNAIEHGGEDVSIRMGHLPDGFYVEDDGPGIPEDHRDQVFDVGFSTSHAGNGFGLSIVNKIIDAHGWEISLTESQTGGARFEITDVPSISEEHVGVP